MEFENEANAMYDRAGGAPKTEGSGKSKCNQPTATFEDFMQTTMNRSTSEPGKAPAERTSIREVSNKLSYPPKKGYMADPVISRLSNIYPGEDGSMKKTARSANRQGLSSQQEYANRLANSISCGGQSTDGPPRLSRQAQVAFMPLSTEYDLGAKTHITVGMPAEGLFTTEEPTPFEIVGRKKGGKPEVVLTALQKFDKAVTAELNRRRVLPTLHGLTLLHKSDDVSESMLSEFSVDEEEEYTRHNLKSTVSGAEIEHMILSDKIQEKLFEAIEKFALADAACTYEGAVKAAEEAAAHAAPEDAEEAAATGARTFTAELEDTAVLEHDGEELVPIEIVGYIGITKPKK